MDRRRRKVPKKNQLCLRLNDAQLLLLQRYAEYKDMDSEVNALRAIIDGLAPWLARRDAEELDKQAHSGVSSAPPAIASVRASVPQPASPPPPPPPHTSLGADETPSSENDGEEVGDFGGQPRLKLPGLPLDGEL